MEATSRTPKDQKTASLGVDRALLRASGSVNSEVARQMVLGAMGRASASVAIAITGVLGPDPDEDGNPAGLVYFAVCRSPGYPVITKQRYAIASPMRFGTAPCNTRCGCYIRSRSKAQRLHDVGAVGYRAGRPVIRWPVPRAAPDCRRFPATHYRVFRQRVIPVESIRLASIES